ncbi:DoxX family protein [Hydrogenothermus marinus]|uniref:Putative oxidoreductase n=1 Tax=Hydrogenothermus marinus TaxID=133270 RepID=A0A3M0C4E3_9AQUI|nr:DoxX family protein [Hydrogenothermus marinus]RMA97812.1 putative oxidoreductase [Hydrogenothermus marinus]
MIKEIYKKYEEILNKSSDFFLLAIRLYWGWLFFRAGFWKFTHYPQATKFFDYLGLPYPEYFVIFIATVETVGGILLFFGIFSRITALILTFNMIGAFIVGHKDALLSIFSKPEDFYMAQPLTFLIASLIVLFFGAGKFSIDYLILNKYFKN